MKGRFGVLARVGLTALLLGAIGWSVDLNKMLEALLRLPLLIVVVATLVASLQIAAGAMRWSNIIRALDGRCSFSFAFASELIALLINQAAPSTVLGDAARVMRLHGAGMHWTPALQSTVLDRLSGVMGLLVLASSACLVLPAAYRYVPLAAILTAAAIVFVILNMDSGLMLVHLERRVPRIAAFVAGGRSVLFSGRRAVPIFGLSIAVHCCSVLLFFVLGEGAGLQLAFSDYLLGVPLVLFAVSVPVSFGGWGAREAAVVALLSYRGVPTETGLAISVASGLALMAVGIVGGGTVLLFERAWGINGNAAIAGTDLPLDGGETPGLEARGGS